MSHPYPTLVLSGIRYPDDSHHYSPARPDHGPAFPVPRCPGGGQDHSGDGEVTALRMKDEGLNSQDKAGACAGIMDLTGVYGWGHGGSLTCHA